MDTTEKRALDVAFAILVCMRITEDLCTEMFNRPFVKQKNRKADILLTYESFEKIRKGLRRGYGKEEYENMQTRICETADELEPYVHAIRNEFVTDVMRKFKYENTEDVSLGLTINSVISVADEMFRKIYGRRAGMIIQILEHLDKFGRRYVVTALNGESECDIDANHAQPFVNQFINKLIEKSTIIES
jgi:hypothetical protein